MKTFLECLTAVRPPRTKEEADEAFGINKVFLDIGLEGDDLIRDRARKHPTFLLKAHWDNHPELRAFDRFPEVTGDILDFGCGSGHLTTLLAEKGLHIDGVDELHSAVAVAKEVSSGSSALRKPEFWQADVSKDPAPRTYDAIWASHVMEHIEDPSGVLLGLKGWLKPGGLIFIAVPFADRYPDPDHVHQWNDVKSFKAFFSPWLTPIKGELDVASGCIRVLFQFK